MQILCKIIRLKYKKIKFFSKLVGEKDSRGQGVNNNIQIIKPLHRLGKNQRGELNLKCPELQVKIK